MTLVFKNLIEKTVNFYNYFFAKKISTFVQFLKNNFLETIEVRRFIHHFICFIFVLLDQCPYAQLSLDSVPAQIEAESALYSGVSVCVRP